MNNKNDLVSVYRVYDSIEAELVKGQLESEGIPCFLKSDNAGGALSYFTTTIGVEIIVNSEDVENARRVIQSREA